MRFKRSYKQMWAYARASKSIKKQNKWLRKIYNQKITESQRYGDKEAVSYLKGVRHRLRARLRKRAKFGGIGQRQWSVATEQDLYRMVTEAKHSGGKGYDNHILIIDDNGNKLIAYEGTALYDEIVEKKRAIAEAVGVDVDELADAIKKAKQ